MSYQPEKPKCWIGSINPEQSNKAEVKQTNIVSVHCGSGNHKKKSTDHFPFC